jgi:hypothetical protein
MSRFTEETRFLKMHDTVSLASRNRVSKEIYPMSRFTEETRFLKMRDTVSLCHQETGFLTEIYY